MQDQVFASAAGGQRNCNGAAFARPDEPFGRASSAVGGHRLRGTEPKEAPNAVTGKKLSDKCGLEKIALRKLLRKTGFAFGKVNPVLAQPLLALRIIPSEIAGFRFAKQFLVYFFTALIFCSTFALMQKWKIEIVKNVSAQ